MTISLAGAGDLFDVPINPTGAVEVLRIQNKQEKRKTKTQPWFGNPRPRSEPYDDTIRRQIPNITVFHHLLIRDGNHLPWNKLGQLRPYCLILYCVAAVHTAGAPPDDWYVAHAVSSVHTRGYLERRRWWKHISRSYLASP